MEFELYIPDRNHAQRGEKMREIKFRGVGKDTKELVYGGIYFSECKKRAFIVSEKEVRKEIHTTYEVIPETVGQFTGLKDKQGKEIYEGDIVYFISNDNRGTLSEVKWGNCGYIVKSDYGVDEYLSEQDQKYINIKGNIYENAELVRNTHHIVDTNGKVKEKD
jgi:uncharacterized phage protein (TIGR01671 family)